MNFLSGLVHPRRNSLAKRAASERKIENQNDKSQRKNNKNNESNRSNKRDSKNIQRKYSQCVIGGMTTQMEALPPLKYIRNNTHEYTGPTDESNWVLKNRLIIGAYPGAVDETLHQDLLTKIMRARVTTFVCLQSEFDFDATEEEWMSGTKIRPYVNDAAHVRGRLVKEEPSLFNGQQVSQINFVHCPIVDCDVQQDEVIIKLATNILRRLDDGEVLYLHCWGGHGRAGTVGSIVLGLLYGLNGEEAMNYIQALHDTRKFPLGVPSPQTFTQRKQVIRILQEFYAKK